MKKVSYFVNFSFILTLIFGFTVMSHQVSAADVQATADVTVSTVDAPAILPANPFYFAKELVRDVRRFFTFGKVNKAEYELQVVDEKAAELAETAKLDPQNNDAIKKALDNYDQNVSVLKTRIESINDTSANPNVDKLLNTFAEQAVRHTEILQDIQGDASTRKQATAAVQTVETTLNDASLKLDTPEKAQARIEQAVQLQGEVLKATPAAATVENQATTSATVSPIHTATAVSAESTQATTGVKVQTQIAPTAIQAAPVMSATQIIR